MVFNKQSNSARPVYIIDGARVPFLKMRTEIGEFSASDLAVRAAQPLLDRQPFDRAAIEQVIVGCVMASSSEANIARVISLRLGCPQSTPAWTVQRNCASGLQAVDCAAMSIASGQCDLILAGGTEVMSRAPLLFSHKMVNFLSRLNAAKALPLKLKTLLSFRPAFLKPEIALIKGLTDPIVNLSMGQTAEEIAYRFNINRLEMDTYAAKSHERALKAKAEGLFNLERLYSSKGKMHDVDDGVREDSTIERLGKLRPVFEKNGNITAGNSSQITDGAAFVILASEEAVKKYGLKPIAVIRDTQWAGLAPEVMGLGPVHAMTPIMQRNNLKIEDIDLFEINEAFAAQVLGCQKAWAQDKFCQEELGLKHAMGLIPMEKLNPSGGAIAMGHPVGASGARLVLQAAQYLQKNNGQRALVSLCIGGGQGGAMLIEKVG